MRDIDIRMAITDAATAVAQYAAALPWQASRESARSALDAVRYLLVARAQHLSDAGTAFSYESLLAEKKALESFLGVSAPRAMGRGRRNIASFQTGGIG